ncbi:MAG TPA: serine hydrolase domain-containing protein [Pirellulales bacterium]
MIHGAAESHGALLPRWLLLVLVFCTRTHFAFGHEFRAARAIIEQAIADGRAPSVAVAASLKGERLWAEGFGWADRESQLKATPDTAYGLGSVSKPITATAIMILGAKGQLELERPANDYLKSARLVSHVGSAEDATLLSLLQHTSGLGSYYETFFADEPDRPPGMDRVIERYGQLLWPARKQFRYTNLGYGVLGRIVELESGKPLGEFLADEVFAPLHMEQTSLGISTQTKVARAARHVKDGTRLPDYEASPAAAADVWSSANDLVRFGQLHCQAPENHLASLPKVAIEQMQTRLQPMGPQQYGLGWVVDRDSHRRRRVRHGGAGAGVGAELTLFSEEGLVVAVLVNCDTSQASNPKILPTIIAEAIADELLPRPNAEPKPAPEIPSLHKHSNLAGTWVGSINTFAGQVRLRCEIDPAGGALLSVDGAEAVPLRVAQWGKDAVTGRFSARLHTADVERRPHELELSVERVGDKLRGSVTALSTHPTRGEALPHWVELSRQDK